MNSFKEVSIPFQNALSSYFKAYFSKRDYNQLEKLLSETFLGYGTGLDEHIYSKSDALTLFRRDLESAPNPINFLFKRKEFRMLDDHTAVFQGELDMQTRITDENFKFNDLRLTLVFHLENNEVKLVAKHISLPTTEQEEGESYPLKELEERKKIKNQIIEIRF